MSKGAQNAEEKAHEGCTTHNLKAHQRAQNAEEDLIQQSGVRGEGSGQLVRELSTSLSSCA